MGREQLERSVRVGVLLMPNIGCWADCSLSILLYIDIVLLYHVGAQGAVRGKAKGGSTVIAPQFFLRFSVFQ